MAYDAAGGVTVLFASRSLRDDLAVAWEWNGSTWTQQSSSGPSPRNAHAMAYDAARGVTVLFGGFPTFGPTVADTWEWNGSNWTLRPSSNAPLSRYSHAIAYDTARGVTGL